MPKISVIIPVYNVEKYLERSLSSLKDQTFTDIEFILIDDCSSDNSLSILNEYKKIDSRFKVIALDKNSGAAVARNKGLEIATGDYLGFVDPDDSIELNFYEELYKIATKEKADIAKSDVININEDGVEKKSPLNKDIKKTKYAFKHEWWSAIYKHSLIHEHNIKFPDDCPKGQDGLFLIEALLNSNKVVITHKTHYNYYRRLDSLDAKKISFEHIKSAMRVKSRMLDYINDSNIITAEKDYVYAYCIRWVSIFYNFFQCDSHEAQYHCIETALNYYKKCKYIDALDNMFIYKKLLPLIKENKIEELINQLSKAKSLKPFEVRKISFYKKLFSVFNECTENNKFKIVYILGFKFRKVIQ